MISWTMANSLFTISNNERSRSARSRCFRRRGPHPEFPPRGAGAARLGGSLNSGCATLEARLGARLLNRRTRSVAITQAGELLWRVLRRRCSISVRRWRIRGLRESPPGACASIHHRRRSTWSSRPWSRPSFAPIRKSRWKSCREPFVDIVAAGFDAGVRYEEHLAKDMIAVSLGPPMLCLAASPQDLARHGTPQTPRDLLGAPCNRLAIPDPEARCPVGVRARAGKGGAHHADPQFHRSPCERGHPNSRGDPDGLGFFADLRGLCARGRRRRALCAAC